MLSLLRAVIELSWIGRLQEEKLLIPVVTGCEATGKSYGQTIGELMAVVKSVPDCAGLSRNNAFDLSQVSP